MTDGAIDLEIFNDLQEATGTEFAAELVGTFLEEAPGMIAALKAAILVADADGYRRAAHSIKSNANTFGATALADQARALEVGDLPDAGETAGAEALEAAFEDAATALKGLINA